ncbi:MAG TPA: THUMP domain-containing protein [Desulfuromonadales bacterium]|nr:THUMP domain-containing protein [Desulfuromonadales bacterium]
MRAFNVVVTQASNGRFRHLLQELSPHGEFRRTEFLGVIIGRVEDPRIFLESIREKRQKQWIAFQDLGRVVPLERVFVFHLEEFSVKAKAALLPYVEFLEGKRFYVRLERRGLKGQIVSPEVERELDAFIEQTLAAAGRKPAQVDFEHPDAVVVVETIGDRCGVGLLTREMMDRYDFVRVD